MPQGLKPSRAKRDAARLKPCPSSRVCPQPVKAVPAVRAGLGRHFTSNPGLASWAKFNRPCWTACKFAVLTQTLKPSSYWPLFGTTEDVPRYKALFEIGSKQTDPDISFAVINNGRLA